MLIVIITLSFAGLCEYIFAIPSVKSEYFIENMQEESSEEECDFHHMVFIPFFRIFGTSGWNHLAYDKPDDSAHNYGADTDYSSFN